MHGFSEDNLTNVSLVLEFIENGSRCTPKGVGKVDGITKVDNHGQPIDNDKNPAT
jgi:hypothetical protein